MVFLIFFFLYFIFFFSFGFAKTELYFTVDVDYNVPSLQNGLHFLLKKGQEQYQLQFLPLFPYICLPSHPLPLV